MKRAAALFAILALFGLATSALADGAKASTHCQPTPTYCFTTSHGDGGHMMTWEEMLP